jgi:Fe-S-cluster containining protein
LSHRQKALRVHTTSRPVDGSLFSFACSSCGKCCNSGPQLSVPELFHHEERLIGCLTLRRVRRVRQDAARGVTREDERSFALLAERLLFALPDGEHALALATQAFYDPELARCALLLPDHRCGVQHDRKPAACLVAPLEAWLPDRMQHRVLAGRLQAAEYLGADCITRGAPGAGGQPLTRNLTVVDDDAQRALQRRRDDLADERRYWGEAVFASLQRQLVDPVALARIPSEGFVSIPPAPLLLVLAAVSERCRQRVLRFVQAQLGLITSTLAVRAGSSAASELARLAHTSERLLSTLAQPGLAQSPISAPHAYQRELEAWLGIDPARENPS